MKSVNAALNCLVLHGVQTNTLLTGAVGQRTPGHPSPLFGVRRLYGGRPVPRTNASPRTGGCLKIMYRVVGFL